ncbi:unnamed protein product [Ostreobium quekettii]|uniref:Uncharacterized protein n=1 Tax=Ostreobium quekettii TaxID=121088 RepID=A0A8S1J2U7_9CHLO|nr:unnamed protein product [Ostreobium quekettii]
MATSGGDKVAEPQEASPAVLCRLMAATAGQVLRRKKAAMGSGCWEPVHLLVRVDLWLIAAPSGKECPTNLAAWRKGDRIELARGQAVVGLGKGEAEWFVESDGGCHVFKAESPAEAACWVSALKRRVCSWHELLQDRTAWEQELLQNVNACNEMTVPVRLDRLQASQEMVKVLGEVAEFTREVLSTLPIAGPALSLLGFAMEVVHRDISDAEELRPAKSLLEEVAKLTIKTLCRAMKVKDEEYEQGLSEVLWMIERAARMLESHEHRSTGTRIKQAMLKMGEGPSAVLDVLKQCQDRLNTLKIDNIENLEMSGLENQERLLANQQKLLAQKSLERKNQEEILANQRKILAQTSLLRKKHCAPSYIPTAPDAVALEGQLCAVRNMLFQNEASYVVVWGMGGIGKTTLARALVGDPIVQNEFKKRAFVTISQNPNIVQCQKQIWDAIVGHEHNVQFTNAENGRLRLQAALKDEVVLIVLDDLWDETDIAHFDVVSAKSRVVITSRNKEVGTCVGARCYAAVALNADESMELFCKHAFASGQPLKWRAPHVKDIVRECGGLPLALKVMAAEAKGFNTGEGAGSIPTPWEKKKWRRAVEGIKSDGVASKGVFDRVFAMSFDSLEDRHRAVLLDLAMLPEDHEARECDVVDMQACDDFSADEAYDVLEELAQRSLIIRTGKHQMDVFEFQSAGFVTCRLHDVVRDSALKLIAGRPIEQRDRVVSSHLKKLGLKSQILSATKFFATHSIGEDRQLDLQKLEMPELQTLVLRNAKMLELPSSLLTANLVVLDLTSSGIVNLPAQVACLQSARVLRLDDCEELSCLPNEIGDLAQLTVLSMRRCRHICELPKSMGRLSNLTKLLMPGCGIAQFLPIDEGNLQNLALLDLSRCFGLRFLPSSLGELTSLTALDLDGCWQLTSLPSSIGQLVQLEVMLLHGCESLMELPIAVTLLGNLTELDVQGCSKLKCLPQGLADGCPELRVLRLQDNYDMAFPEVVTELQQLEVLGVRNDWTLPTSMSEKLQDHEMSLESLECEPTEEYSSTQYEERDTPLHWAAALGLTEMVKFHLGESSGNIQSSCGYTPLHRAAQGGHTAVVELILDAGASVDAVDQSGCTPLHWAVQYGHTATAELLLSRDASVDAADQFGYTPLHRAAQYEHSASAELLLDRDAPVDAMDQVFGYTPLHRAAQGGHRSVVVLLLDRRASVDAVDQDGYTPLLWASQGGHTATVELLLDRGASVYVMDQAGYTPLHWAAQGGHSATVELLLDRGASVDDVDQAGSTPLHWAAQGGHKGTVEVLLDRCASVEALSHDGYMPLHRAAQYGHTATVELLLHRGAPVNIPIRTGYTPLHWAGQYGHTAVVELLLDRRASADLQDQHGCTSLHRAAQGGHAATVELLLDRNASVDTMDKDGCTALHRAVQYGHAASVELLLERGASVDIPSQAGYTPLHWAAEGGHTAVVELLLDRGASVDAVDQDSHMPHHRAAQFGHTATVEFLLNKGASVDALSQNGCTALHWAAQYGYMDTVELLLDADASVDAADQDGHTPLHMATQYGHTTTVHFLLDRHASVDALSQAGETPLIVAAKKGTKAIVDLLLKGGARADVVDKSGQGPAALARATGDLELAEMLGAAAGEKGDVRER